MQNRVVLAVALIGCGNTHAPIAPDAPHDAPPESVDSMPPDAAPHAVTFTGGLEDESRAPISGAQACFYGGLVTPSCATTLADGTYSIEIEVGTGVTRIAGQFVGSAYGGLVLELPITGQTTTSSVGTLTLSSEADTTAFLATGGFTYPSTTTGLVEVVVEDPSTFGFAPATVTIGGSGSTTAVYCGSAGALDPSAVDSSDGPAYLGNLLPGTYPLTVQAPGLTCTESGNDLWPPAGSETVDAPVIAGSITFIYTVECD